MYSSLAAGIDLKLETWKLILTEIVGFTKTKSQYTNKSMDLQKNEWFEIGNVISSLIWILTETFRFTNEFSSAWNFLLMLSIVIKSCGGLYVTHASEAVILWYNALGKQMWISADNVNSKKYLAEIWRILVESWPNYLPILPILFTALCCAPAL